jgi:hypothetical protein
MTKYLIAALCGLTLSACQSTRQTQALSDAKAGTQAISLVAGKIQADVGADASLHAAMVPILALAQGTGDYIDAALVGETVPPPTRTPESIAADAPAYAVATVNHQAPDGTIVGREPVEFEVTDPDGAPICDIREAFLELARCGKAALEARVAAIQQEQEALRDKVERQRMREKLLAPIQMAVRGKG